MGLEEEMGYRCRESTFNKGLWQMEVFNGDFTAEMVMWLQTREKEFTFTSTPKTIPDDSKILFYAVRGG